MIKVHFVEAKKISFTMKNKSDRYQPIRLEQFDCVWVALPTLPKQLVEISKPKKKKRESLMKFCYY